jgi:small membrane protein
MIAIQLILVLGFILFLWWFLTNPASHQASAWTKILTFLFTILAIIVVIFPDISNSIAHSVGVKTGANLLLYCLTLGFIFVLLNLYIKGKEQQRRLVRLVRHVTLLESELNKLKSKKN